MTSDQHSNTEKVYRSVDLLPIDFVFQQANRVTVGGLMVVVAHCSILLATVPTFGIWTIVAAVFLTLGIYHTHLKIHAWKYLKRPVPFWAPALWPWVTLLYLAVVATAGLVVCVLVTLAALFLMYLPLRAILGHVETCETIGVWGLFPAVACSGIAGVTTVYRLAAYLLRLVPRKQYDNSQNEESLRHRTK